MSMMLARNSGSLALARLRIPQRCFATSSHSGCFRSFEDARAWVRTLGLQGQREWRALGAVRPPDIPSNPNVTYREQWAGLHDWLGLPHPRARNLFNPSVYREASSHADSFTDRQLTHVAGIERAKVLAPNFRFFTMPSSSFFCFNPVNAATTPAGLACVSKRLLPPESTAGQHFIFFRIKAILHCSA